MASRCSFISMTTALISRLFPCIICCADFIFPRPMCTSISSFFFFFNDTATTEIYTLSLHDALPICGHWAPCSKEEIKRRVRDKQVRLLVCTDAAGEGLNLQFAGVLVNYDLPWNPMKVEQRIGRIDRLGQSRPVIRILSFAYKDTVEQDVFFTVGSRINLFQGIVGRLQPILSRLPRRFEELALLDRDSRDGERARFLAEIEEQVRDV